MPFVDVTPVNDDDTLITVVWLLGMTQAINLIDGLDGLAAASSPSAHWRSSIYTFGWRTDGSAALTTQRSV